MKIKVIKDNISKAELTDLAKPFYGNMIKGVIDIENEIIAFGGEYHMDANIILLDNGSAQKHIWGFNVHLEKDKDNWIEYTSLINIRPTDNNFDMEVKDKDIRDKMKKIINSKII